jgi:hypothetical protein
MIRPRLHIFEIRHCLHGKTVGQAMKKRRLRYNIPVPVSRCKVSYTDMEGIVHAVEVDAGSLYEAVALAVAEFREDEIITDTPAPMTEFCVTVLRRPVEHRVRFQKVQEWVQPTTKGGPAGIILRERLRKLLGEEA